LITRDGLALFSAIHDIVERMTRTCLPYSENSAVCGFMSMQAISSPRLGEQGYSGGGR
jgi:hypothetical protein